MGQCAPTGDVYTLYWRAARGRLPGEASSERFYTLDFVGRRSSYAHDLPNQHRFVIVVDRLISVQKAGPKLSDAEFQAFRESNPGMTERCLIENHYLGFAAWQPDDPNCFEMLPDQRWSGLWDTGWEWSIFCPDGAKNCGAADRGITLRFAERSYFKEPLPWGRYHVEFVGRRTKVPGHFGHLSHYAHLMVVDRMISIQKIPGEKYTKPF